MQLDPGGSRGRLDHAARARQADRGQRVPAARLRREQDRSRTTGRTESIDHRQTAIRSAWSSDRPGSGRCHHAIVRVEVESAGVRRRIARHRLLRGIVAAQLLHALVQSEPHSRAPAAPRDQRPRRADRIRLPRHGRERRRTRKAFRAVGRGDPGVRSARRRRRAGRRSTRCTRTRRR